MLKLIKNYKTKELEKYGFIFDGYGNWIWGGNAYWCKKMYINEAERVLHIDLFNVDKCIDMVFDMIKDGVFDKGE